MAAKHFWWAAAVVVTVAALAANSEGRVDTAHPYTEQTSVTWPDAASLRSPSVVVPREWGTACTSDCSGHEAGYEWAEENDISDSSDCDGNSQSFIDGCIEFAEEQTAATVMEDGEEDEDE